MSVTAKAIRAAVVAGLKAEHTRAGERVFGNRTRPVWKDTMPVLLVFTGPERAELFQVSPKVYRRTLEVSIVAVDHEASAPDDVVDDRLDELADVVERFMFRDPRLGILDPGPDAEIEDARYLGAELVTFDLDGRTPNRPIAGQRIRFEVRYLTEAAEGRSEDCQPFLGADLVWNSDQTNGQDEARDRVDLEGP